MIQFFKSTEDVKIYLPNFYKNTDFGLIDNSLQEVTRLFIVPFFGKTLLAEIEASTAETHADIKSALQTAIINYFIVKELPTRTFIFSTAGAKTTDTDKTNNLSLSEIKFRQSEALKIADSFLDIALDEVTTDAETFAAFAPKYPKSTRFFKNAADLSDIINVEGFRAFCLIAKFLQQVEKTELVKLVGNPLLTFLQNDTNPANVEAITTATDLIKKYVAWKGLSKAIPQLLFTIEADGVKILSSSNGYDKREHIQKNHLEMLNKWQGETEENADFFKSELVSFLNRNDAIFTTYADYITATATTKIDKHPILGGNAGMIF